VEEMLPLLWIFRLNLSDLSGGNIGIDIYVNNLLPFVIPIVEV